MQTLSNIKKSRNNTKADATAAADTADRPAETGEGVRLSGMFTSPDCGRVIKGLVGVSVHRRTAHSELYPAENLPTKLR